MTSLGMLRRSVGIHARDPLLSVTLPWKPAGLSTMTPAVTCRQLAEGAAKGRVGVPGMMLPARSAVTSTLPSRPLEEGPTARKAAMVVVAVCDVVLPANFKGKTATMPTGRWGRGLGRTMGVAGGARGLAGGGRSACLDAEGGEERSGAVDHALCLRARSPRMHAVSSSTTMSVHLTIS